MRYQFELKAKTSILFHADDVMWADHIEAQRKDPKRRGAGKPGDDRSPAWTWLGYLYNDGEHVTIPSENLQKCLSQAGARLTMKGRKTFKEAAVTGIWLDQEASPLELNGKPIPMTPLDGLKEEENFLEHVNAAKKLGFDLFVKRVRVNKAKHVRVRPRFKSWTTRGTLEVRDANITTEVLTTLFTTAGTVGLGDWRPGGLTPGRYGMFDATVTPLKGGK